MKLIDVKDFEMQSSLFRGKGGHWLAEMVMRITAFDKVNRVYDHSCRYNGSDFAAHLLSDVGVNYLIGQAERLKKLPEGAFITVSNHPYGGLDGIILIDLMARLRPDYRLMVNQILYVIDTMRDNFICVTPRSDFNKKITADSIKGIREAITFLREGHPVGFFPSGAVSDFSLKNFRVRDRAWQGSVLKLIRSARVPILPVRFFDGNSPLFYFLGLIDWRIRLIRMPHEIFNKRKHRLRIGIGNLISVEEQDQFRDGSSLGQFLRKTVYEMPMSTHFVSSAEL